MLCSGCRGTNVYVELTTWKRNLVTTWRLECNEHYRERVDPTVVIILSPPSALYKFTGPGTWSSLFAFPSGPKLSMNTITPVVSPKATPNEWKRCRPYNTPGPPVTHKICLSHKIRTPTMYFLNFNFILSEIRIKKLRENTEKTLWQFAYIHIDWFL